MNKQQQILGFNKTKILLLSFAALLLLSSLGLTLHPVIGQEQFNLNWAFNYSPLVSGAANSLNLSILNTALAPVRLLSVGIRFPWMQTGTYLSPGIPQTGIDLAPAQEVHYTIPLEIPADTLTGRYAMETVLQCEVFQTTQFSGPESIAYVLDVIVLGRSSSFSMTFDPYDGRFYSAVAVLTLLGWYLPKKLLRRTKGENAP
jgi:hypothetical protein